MEPKEIQEIIEKGFPDAKVKVIGDGHHFNAVIVSQVFEGKGLLEQQRLVYEVLGENMKEKIHAISLKTLTPEQEQEN